MINRSYVLKSLLLLALLSTAYALTGDSIADAKRITACILKLVYDFSPWVTFAFLLLGGLTYLTSAESKKQKIMGKRLLVMGIAGIACVLILVDLAALPMFAGGIRIGDCTVTAASQPPPVPGTRNFLFTPPNNGHVTGR